MVARGSTEIDVDSARRRVLASAADPECFSAREIRLKVHALHDLRTALPTEQHQTIEAELSRGLILGFETFVEQDDAARSRWAGNHPKRRQLLDRTGDVPYVVHEDLMLLTDKSAFSARVGEDIVYPPMRWTNVEERAALARRLDIALRLIRFLTLLALAAKRKLPVALLLELFRLLRADWLVPKPTASPGANTPPVRVTRPPGSAVLAEPRVARAPGRGAPLAAHNSEGRVRPCAPGGAL
ncbi:hypothetical protein F0L68_00250 [Solihabitans fulvus]|uniref:Uncharacterized protein n=1 Tax=Solihabitans fulvus TaxID=1892852 RepID=A0A5B2XV19_9PSEU|nr:hypothetical protein [Solihabitans fulvus]KAA2267005.1 hypothetical protein F0L68_00250 [Solihabitans fulvus]